MGSQTVREVMTAKVVAVRRDAGFKQLVDVLADFKVSAVPVIDRELHVLGVVSEADQRQRPACLLVRRPGPSRCTWNRSATRAASRGSPGRWPAANRSSR